MEGSHPVEALAEGSPVQGAAAEGSLKTAAQRQPGDHKASETLEYVTPHLPCGGYPAIESEVKCALCRQKQVVFCLPADSPQTCVKFDYAWEEARNYVF